jgi:phosphohistidine phosphatase
MQVFVLRHGQAETQQITDEARNLTARGQSDIAASARASLTELRNVQEIWASPLVRAQQTAQIVYQILVDHGINPLMKTTDQIAPESNPAVLFNMLQASHSNSILVVSHQPFVGNFIGGFCGGPPGAYPMDTGSMALIECNVAARSCGELRWLRHVPG